MLVKSENGVARAGLSEVMATFAQSPAAIIAKMNFVVLPKREKSAFSTSAARAHGTVS